MLSSATLICFIQKINGSALNLLLNRKIIMFFKLSFYHHIFLYISIFLSNNLIATTVEIINDMHQNFLIIDHPHFAISIKKQESKTLELQPHTILYIYQEVGNEHYFQFLYTLNCIENQTNIIYLTTTDIITGNLHFLYPHQFITKRCDEVESTTQQPINHGTHQIKYPTTVTETENFLASIKKQQMNARENAHNKQALQPRQSTKTGSIPNEELAQKLAFLATSRQKANIHPFARSARK